MLSYPFIAIACLLSVPPLASYAAESIDDALEAARDPQAIGWPETPRPRSKVTHLTVDIDGSPEKRLVFDCGRFSLITDNLGKWATSDQTNPRFSMQLIREGQPELEFGIARFPDNNFLQSLDQEQWNGYIAFLTHPPSPKTVTYQRYSPEKKASPIILNEKRYRQIEYEYTNSEGVTVLTREFFTFLNAELFVFVFSGPKREMEAMRTRQNLLISRMGVHSQFN